MGQDCDGLTGTAATGRHRDGTSRPACGPEVAARLALAEARRLPRHPVLLAGVGLHALSIARGPHGPRDAFDIATAEPTPFVGVATCSPAALAATRTRRSGAGELLAPVPTGEHLRTVALCLAGLAPALACAGLVLVAHALALREQASVVAPGLPHLVQGPLTVRGAARPRTVLACGALLSGLAVAAGAAALP